MDLVPIELDFLLDLAHGTIYPGPDETRALQFIEYCQVSPLPATNQGGQDQQPGPGRKALDGIDDFLGRLLPDFPSADRAVGKADPGVEQAQVVVGLGHRPDGRARVVGDTLLINGNRRGEPFDVIDVGLVELPEKLAGVGR